MSPVSLAPPLNTSHLEQLQPVDVVRWAAEQHGADRLVVTASFGDAVLVHVANSAAPGIEIALLDTQYLFAETHWFAKQLVERFDLNVSVLHPEVAPDDLWLTDPTECCRLRKVDPLQRALDGKAVWITGLRRADSATRATAPVAAFDLAKQVLKVNPLATLSDDDVALYEQLHDLPHHPLSDRGYPSIGCWPCTRPVAPGDDKRAGRWADSAKTECGLHL